METSTLSTLLATTITTTKKPKYNPNDDWSIEVQIFVPIATMIAFVLAQAIIYILDDPGLVKMRAAGIGIGELDYEDYEDDVEKGYAKPLGKSSADAGEHGVNSNNRANNESNTGSRVNLRKSSLSQLDEWPRYDGHHQLRRVKTDIQIASMPNETEVLLLAYLMKRPAFTDSTQLQHQFQRQQSQPHPHHHQSHLASRIHHRQTIAAADVLKRTNSGHQLATIGKQNVPWPFNTSIVAPGPGPAASDPSASASVDRQVPSIFTVEQDSKKEKTKKMLPST